MQLTPLFEINEVNCYQMQYGLFQTPKINICKTSFGGMKNMVIEA